MRTPRELGSLPGTFPVAFNARAKCMAAWSPGSILGRRNHILVFDIANPNNLTKFVCGSLHQDRIAFSNSGQLLAAGNFTRDHTMKGFVIDRQDGKTKEFFEGDVNMLSLVKPTGSRCVAFDPSDRLLAVAAEGGTPMSVLTVQSILTGKPQIVIRTKGDLKHFNCKNLVWSPDGTLLAQLGTYTEGKYRKSSAIIWKISYAPGEQPTCKHLINLEYPGGELLGPHPVGLAFDATCDVVAVGGNCPHSNQIKLYSLNPPKHIFDSPGLGAGICWLEYVSGTDLLASGGMDGVLRFWQIVATDEATSLVLRDEVQCGGQIAGGFLEESGKTFFIIHAKGKKETAVSTIDMV